MNTFIKKILVILAAAITLMAGNFQLLAKPVDFSIGGTALYNWWNPAWNNRKLVLYTPEIRKVVDTHAPQYTVMRQFLYGPDISIKFLQNWELSPSFQYGESSTQGGGFALYPDLVYRTLTINIKQYKIYTSIGYYFLEYFKCYLGLRVEIINNSINYKHLESKFPLNIFFLGIDTKTLHVTPEAGFNVIVPISALISFMCSLSGTFQSGSNRSDYKKSYDRYGPKFNFRKIPRDIYIAVGGNTSLAFKINIPAINTSLTLGAYYRMLKYFQKNHDRGLFDLDGSYDHNYGFMCSIAYTLSFGKRKKQRLWIPHPNYER